MYFTITITYFSSVSCEGIHVHSCSRYHAHAQTPGRVLSPLPPFMWNGSLPADKSIGFALRTPTCDNKRVYRQPTARRHSVLQLQAEVTSGEEEVAVTKTHTSLWSVDYAPLIESLHVARQTLHRVLTPFLKSNSSTFQAFSRCIFKLFKHLQAGAELFYVKAKQLSARRLLYFLLI